MQKRVVRFSMAVAALMVGATLLVACQTATPAPTQAPAKPAAEPTRALAPTAAPAALTKAPAAPTAAPAASPAAGGANTLTAVKVSAAPKIDGDPSDADWAKAQAMTVKVAGGVNLANGATDVSVKALYDNERAYFLMQYADATQSLRRFPWQKQADGSWKQLGETSTGDAKQLYEDKFAIIWNIDDSIKGFNAGAGCMVACHVGEGKPYGNKYTASAGEKGDIWHLKTVRTASVGKIDDQFLDDTRYDKEKAPEAGRKGDASTGGGYKKNVSQDKKTPAFAAPDNKPAPPYWIEDAKKVAFDNVKYKANDEVAGIIVAPYQGDRGDIDAGMAWKDGKWTFEFSRKLTTVSDRDVQFRDLAKEYFFGVAVFDDAQVRHAFQGGVSKLVFAK